MVGVRSRHFIDVPEALERVRSGDMVVIWDDSGKEGEGDIMVAAERAGVAVVTFMARFGGGLVCLASGLKRLADLDIQRLVSRYRLGDTPFYEPIDYRRCKTGISAGDRALTIEKFLDGHSVSADFERPGHVITLGARDGGLLERTGHTEASVDLARMAGMSSAAVICEVMNANGSMADMPDLLEFSGIFQVPLVSLGGIKQARLAGL